MCWVNQIPKLVNSSIYVTKFTIKSCYLNQGNNEKNLIKPDNCYSCRPNGKDSILISPFSITTPLNMTLTGVNGATFDAVKPALRKETT